MSTTIPTNRTSALRDALAWVEARDWPGHTIVNVDGNVGAQRAGVWVHVYEAKHLATVRRLIGPMAKVEKAAGGLKLVADPISSVRVTVFPPQGTCRQVETGEVEEYEEVVEQRTETRTRPVMRWECPESVLDDATAEPVTA